MKNESQLPRALLITARIRPESPRHAEWVEVLGTDTVPLLHPFSEEATVAGTSGLFLLLAVGQLTPVQQTRLAAHLSRKFGQALVDIEREMFPEEGTGTVPVLAADVTIGVDGKAFL